MGRMARSVAGRLRGARPGVTSHPHRRIARRGTPLLVVCLLCAVGATAAAVALAAPRHDSRHRSHTAKGCRHTKHHRCSSHRKHKRGMSSKPGHTRRSTSKGSGSTGGSTGPGTVGTPASPGAPPASAATPPGAGGKAPPAEPPGGPAAPTRVQVTAEDTEGMRFVLSRTSVPAGEAIIEFVNHGQDEHNLHAVQSSEGTEAGSLPNTTPGAHPQLRLDLRPGSYTLFCSLPGHEAKGMKATLVVN
jgi:plastocyanin